ncbi:MAG: DUF1850 domain-containing protein [Halarsenatibacteraceae bacterium]
MKMKKLIIILVFILISVIALNNIIALIVFSSDEAVIEFKPVLAYSAEVELRYIHSVAKTPVFEYFSINEDSFLLKKTVFESFGAGLPLDGGEFKRENGKFVREGQNTRLDNLVIRVSRTKGQEIVIAGEIFDLQDLLEPGERLIIDVFSPINYFRYRFKNK